MPRATATKAVKPAEDNAELKTIDLLNDVAAPLTLFKSFLDRVCGNGFGSDRLGDHSGAPSAEEQRCLEGGRLIIEKAIADMYEIHNQLDEHDQMLGFKVRVR